MVGVDLKDQLLESFLLERKRTKVWYKKLFNHLSGQFRNQLVRSPMSHNPKKCESITLQSVHHGRYHASLSTHRRLEKRKGRPSNTDTECTRLTGQHLIQENPKTETFRVGRRKCVMCTKSGKRKETRYRCKNCPGTPSLCLDPCFEQYHTQ
ncbi:hypothetical protein J437_LFUL018545, partial [Ladona fulva]